MYDAFMYKEDLIGKWKINRLMIHPNGFSKGRMMGIGQFDLHEESQLLYREKLWHENKNKNLFFATKFYRYHFSDTSIAIYFHQEENERLFMVIDKNLKGYATCRLDHYRLTWNWICKDHFITRYEAKGPKKNYIIESEFLR